MASGACGGPKSRLADRELEKRRRGGGAEDKPRADARRTCRRRHRSALYRLGSRPPLIPAAEAGRLVAFSIHPLPQKLAVAAHGLGFLPGLALGRLLIGTAQLHFPEDAFALHLLLERFQRLIDVVVSYDYVNDGRHSFRWKSVEQTVPRTLAALAEARGLYHSILAL